jgi:hypothetical protein
MNSEDALERIEKLTRAALAERDEHMALSAAIGTRTGRQKSAKLKGYENGLVRAYCEALVALGWNDCRTPTAVQLMLQNRGPNDEGERHG